MRTASEGHLSLCRIQAELREVESFAGCLMRLAEYAAIEAERYEVDPYGLPTSYGWCVSEPLIRMRHMRLFNRAQEAQRYLAAA